MSFVCLCVCACVQEDGSIMKTVFGKVQSSYLRSMSELSELLRKRMDMLKALKI